MKTEAEIGGMQLQTREHQGSGAEPGERQELPAGSNLTDILILGFWSPDLQNNTFLLYKASSFMELYYSSPRKPVQTPILSSMLYAVASSPLLSIARDHPKHYPLGTASWVHLPGFSWPRSYTSITWSLVRSAGPTEPESLR